MNVKVIYFSRTGSTKKVAEAMAEAAGCAAERSDEVSLDSPVDLAFIGGAVYATYDHDYHPSVYAALEKLKAAGVKRVVPFGTYAFGSSQHKLIERIKAAGLTLADETFECRGKFLFFNRKSPTPADLERARETARKAVSLG